MFNLLDSFFDFLFDFPLQAIYTLAVIFAFFLIIREIVLWYWKISKAITALESQEFALRRIANTLKHIEEKMPAQSSDQAPKETHTPSS